MKVKIYMKFCIFDMRDRDLGRKIPYHRCVCNLSSCKKKAPPPPKKKVRLEWEATA